MARPHRPWYRAGRKTWYVQIAGKQHPLARGPKAETRQAAYDAMYRLLAAADAPDPNAPADTVAGLLARFLGWTRKHKAKSTYDQRRYYLRSFARFRNAKALRPDRVTVDLVEDWLDAYPRWKASRRHATLALLRAFNWAVRRRRLSSNPIAGIDLPTPKRVQSYLTRDQRQALLGATRDRAFRRLLAALEGTGCRPGEVAAVTAADADLGRGVWVLQAHKTGKRTGRPRTVYLTAEMVELTKELAAENPAGPLFRNSRGRPWTRNAIRCRFRALRAKFPGFGHFTAYSFRRAFVTDALEHGVGVAQVAELVGHTSTEMVMRHYAQLQERVAHMREMTARAAGKGRPAAAKPRGCRGRGSAGGRAGRSG